MFWRLVSTVLLLLPLTWGIRNAYRLYLNYGSARKIGVPIIVLPISPQNPIWMLLADIVVPVFQKFSITRSWPLIRFGRRAWEFGDKAKIHLELGDVLIMVTPDKNVLYICDAKTLAEVVQRRNEFKRPQEILSEFFLQTECHYLSRSLTDSRLEMLSVFGPNISTVSTDKSEGNTYHSLNNLEHRYRTKIGLATKERQDHLSATSKPTSWYGKKLFDRPERW